MRTAQEIASELNTLNQALRGISLTNVHGWSQENLDKLEANKMDIERRLHQVMRERHTFITGA